MITERLLSVYVLLEVITERVVTVCVHANKKQFQFKINKNTFYLSKMKQCVHFLRSITDRQILSSKMVKNMMEVFADLL